jgi:NAD(P)-dependent dehydrogenase (short-subunit alcohol dehydrogenase family)
MDAAGRTAIVTGGASGLGEAAATLLAAAGAKVAILDLDEQRGHARAARIDAMFERCDVADAGEAEGAIEKVSAALGRPSILVNCAGIGTAARIVGRDGPLPLEDFEKVVRVNLVGSFNMLRLAAHAMSRAAADEGGQRGVIVSTASVAAFEGQVGQAAYAASKGGIVALTLPAARELSRFGIRVVAIAPGLFSTPLIEDLPPEAAQTLVASIPNPARLGRPAEFADMVMAVIRNDYLNGEVIRLDGALRLPAR